MLLKLTVECLKLAHILWRKPTYAWSNYCMKGQSLTGGAFLVQIQLIRIELRVPEYGWTTQKVFHLMNFIVNGGIGKQSIRHSIYLFLYAALIVKLLNCSACCRVWISSASIFFTPQGKIHLTVVLSLFLH